MGFCGFGWNRCNWGCGDRWWGRGGCGGARLVVRKVTEPKELLSY